MRKVLIIIFTFLIFQNVHAQQTNVAISGTYSNISFKEFAQELQDEYGVTIYFYPEWVEAVKVNASYQDKDLKAVLSEIFALSEVNYYIDSDNNVILYKAPLITEKLPAFEGAAESEEETPVADEDLTRSERKYIAGRQASSLELIKVGSPQKTVQGKKTIIRGKIFDNATGEPLFGATIFIKELGVGAATDFDGQFNIALDPGKYQVTASSLSMKEKSFYIEVFSDGTLSIPLEKGLLSISEVKVFGDRNNNVSGMQMGYERISSKSIKEIPAIMGERDLLKIAQMLPGVQSAGEGSSGLIVRGGNADQNLFYINKLPVYNTAHMFGFFSAFSPDIVSSFTLYKSNIPAKYGGRISSVFDISTRQGNKKEFFGKGGISPVTGHIMVEGPVLKDKSSFVLSYRGTYSDWILSRVDNLDLRNSKASFYDLSGTLNTEINKKNLLKVFGYSSYDNFSLAESDDYDYSNNGASVSWKHIFSTKLNVELSAVASQYKFTHNNKRNPSEAYNHLYKLNHTEFKADFLYLTGKDHRISFGVSSILYKLNRGNIEPYNAESTRIPVALGTENGVEGALYVSDEFTLLPRLTALVGLRYSYYSMLGPKELNEYAPGLPKNQINIVGTKSFSDNEVVKSYSGFEPRIAFNYLLGYNNSVKVSYNRMQQYIFMLSNTIAIAPTDQWKLADYYLKPPTADQISLGYYHDFPEKGLVTSIEVYRKWINNLVEYKDGVDFISSDPTEMLLLQGEQDSYGLEFILKKNSGKLTGWVSYSYSSSTVKVIDNETNESINLGQSYPSNFDKPHSFNFVSNYKATRRISFSTVVTYSTGRPITYPVSLYYAGNKQVLHYSERNEFRIPDYFRVDLSLSYEGNLKKKKWLHSTWMLNVYNATARKNAYSVFPETEDGNIKFYKLSIFAQPIITLSWNFKFGNFVSE